MIDELRKQVADIDAEISDNNEKIVGLKYDLSVIELDKKGIEVEKIRLAINRAQNIENEIEAYERVRYELLYRRGNLQKRIGEIENEQIITHWNGQRITEYNLVVKYNALCDEMIELLTQIMALHGSPPEEIRDRVIKSVIGSVWSIPKFDLSAIKIKQNYTDEDYKKIMEGIQVA
jgi:hypothetical protein